MARYFLGLDSSTQGLKAALIDERCAVQSELVVNFDSDLPMFKTEGGVHRHTDGLTVTSPAIMWVAALDLLAERMQAAGWPLGNVAAVSGSGQQHGSVWLKHGAVGLLRSLNPAARLADQLQEMFSLGDSPIWMDSSTRRECESLESVLGGPQAVADLTGSRAYERFTGNQIAKIWRTRPDVYDGTERVALVSSFVASLLVGDYAPIDASDGSGMNLMDIRGKAWADRAMQATAPALHKRLGVIVPSHTDIGPIHAYYVHRYGFPAGCRVVAFSGDNPCSLAGLRLQKAGDVAISLGTSDTVFGSLAQPVPSASEGHIFVNPVDPAGYMALVCYKNGSLTREHVRDEVAGGSWDAFNRMLAATTPGNSGRIGFFIRAPEITPPILKTGTVRFDRDGLPVDRFDGAADVRAVVESQFLSMRIHGANIGLKPSSILVTGGASANAAIVQMIADVFGVAVMTGEQPNSASVGAAYRALHGWKCREANQWVSFAEVMAGAPPFRTAARPDAQAHKIYTGMLPVFKNREVAAIARILG